MRRLLLFSVLLIVSTQLNAQTAPILHYSFDSSNAQDEVGTQDGILYGVTPCNDRFGNIDRAFYFSNDAYIHHTGLTFGSLTEASISLWVAPDNASLIGPFSSTMVSTGYWAVNFNRYNTPSSYGYLYSIMDGTSNDNSVSDGAGPISSGTWSHLVATNDGTTTRLYVNGVLESTYAENFMFINNTYDLYVGVRGYGNNAPADYYQGKMDELKIFGKALTQTEIEDLYNETNPYVSVPELVQSEKEVVKIVNLLGQETEFKPNTVLIYIYSDGSSERVFKLEK